MVLDKIIKENTLDEASSSISGTNSGLLAVDSSVVKVGEYILHTTTGGMEINIGDIKSHMDNATVTKDKDSSRCASISYKATSDAAIAVITKKKDWV